MNENYLIFNDIGILTESLINELSKGNHNVDYFYIGYYKYNYMNSYCTIAITLPNGVELPELATSQKEFEFNNRTYEGYMIKFPETLTAIAGDLTMTIVLKNIEDDTELYSSQINLLIHDTDNVIEPTITELQYNQMQETIREEFAEVNRQIKSGALKGDKGDAATIRMGVVTISDSPNDAKVENIGTVNDAILNFTIPRGLKGEKGDSGTSNYLDLDNKPQINGVELDGNKKFDELGLMQLTNTEIENLLK